MHMASRKGHLALVQLLCEAGADKDAATELGWTPLILAAHAGHCDVMRFLCEVGADKEKQSHDGQTPLFMASRKGHVAGVALLCEAGADTDRALPLHAAVDSGHVEVVRLLCGAGASTNAADEQGWTSLHVASKGGHLDCVQLLCGAGAQKDAEADRGWTPLHWAAHEGHCEVVRCLSEELGAYTNWIAQDGQTPLHVASRKGHIATVRLLCDLDAEIDPTAEVGTPLSRKSCSDVMRFIAEVRAEKECGGQECQMPSHRTWRKRREAAVELGSAPMLWASYQSHHEVLRLLREVDRGRHSPECLSPLSVASGKGRAASVRLLCDTGGEEQKAGRGSKAERQDFARADEAVEAAEPPGACAT